MLGAIAAPYSPQCGITLLYLTHHIRIRVRGRIRIRIKVRIRLRIRVRSRLRDWG